MNGLKRHILYLDYNSIYATNMCSFIPMEEIKTLNDEKKEFIDAGFMNHDTDGERGFWVHLDTKYIS